MKYAPAALMLYSGPRHVIVKASAEVIARAGFDPTGMPAREVFVLPEHRPAQRVMDLVYALGEALEVIVDDGRLLIAPRRQNGRIVGIATHWSPLPQTPVAPPVEDRQPVAAA